MISRKYFTDTCKFKIVRLFTVFFTVVVNYVGFLVLLICEVHYQFESIPRSY